MEKTQADWIEVQESLKKQLITEDDFEWKLLTSNEEEEQEEEENRSGVLKYIGGVDISFSKEDSSIACGTIVVLDLKTLDVVYQDFSIVAIDVPYIPGFLAFREAPILLQLLEKMKNTAHPFYPQLLMVDGNGLLHPRGFGLACHLGVLANIPTIGIGKNLHHVDGLTQLKVRELLEAEENFERDVIPLIGDSGHMLGAAMQSTQGSRKPIFVSVGHRVSLVSAIEIVKRTCKYRVPEPIRQWKSGLGMALQSGGASFDYHRLIKYQEHISKSIAHYLEIMYLPSLSYPGHRCHWRVLEIMKIVRTRNESQHCSVYKH